MNLYNGVAMTPREIKILIYLAAGLTHRQIANEIGLSPMTMKNAVHGIGSKVGIHGSAALASWALITGRITGDEVVRVWQTYYPHLLEAS